LGNNFGRRREALPRKQSEEFSNVVTTAQISEILGVSKRRIQQLADDGALVRLNRGHYDLAASIQTFIDFQIEKNKPNDEIDKDVEQALWTRAKKEKTQLEVKIIKGELHRSKDVERIMSDMLGAFRARLLNLPDKVAPMLIAKTELQEIQEIVKLATFEALNELSEYDPEVYYDYSTDKLFLEKDEDEEEENIDYGVVPKNGKHRK
jgi:phage terminase Nu1 subunit (DNA packaging protein)